MAQSDDEDDYMKMVFEDPKSKETSLQRRMRIEREGSSRGYNKSKAEREAEATVARDAALNTAIDKSSKGFKMMAKLGFKEGDVLGKSESALKEPIRPNVRGDRSGIGCESKRKRKFRETAEKMAQDTEVVSHDNYYKLRRANKHAKRHRISEAGYRERKRQIREDKRMEAKIENAQKTAEQLEEQREEKERNAQDGEQKKAAGTVPSKPLKSIHVTWRGLVRRRLERKQKEEEKHRLKMARILQGPYFNNYDGDDVDKTALGGDAPKPRELVDDLEEDEELEAFEALPLEDRLKQIVAYLRERFHYCFWCAHQYANSDMGDCPGESEESHDIILKL